MTEKVKGRTAAGSQGGEKRYPDPYGLYRQWFDVLEKDREGTRSGGPVSPAELGELWKRWFEAMVPPQTGSKETGKGFSDDMASLWTEMAEDVSAKMLSEETFPEDPLRFFLQWYNETEERWSEAADELLRKGEVLEQASHSIEAYARSYRELRRASEEGSKNLQVPTRSDITRVAKLVVVVENKVDRIEEAVEEFVHGDSGFATAGAVAEAVHSLEERMDRLEGKMDRILTALEKIEAGGKLGSGTSPGPTRGKSDHTARDKSAGGDEASSDRANGLGYS